MAIGGNRTHRRLGVLLCALAGFAGTTGLAHPGPAWAADDPQARAERQVTVVEKLLDQMLVDSPNFLVAGQEATEGFAIDDYGAIFAFRASLTGWGWERRPMNGLFDFWPFSTSKRGVGVIRLDKGEGGHKEIVIADGQVVIKNGDVYVKDGDKERQLSEKDGATIVDEKEYREDQLKKYAAAKEELIRFLLEYGETLKALPAGQSVRIVARMHDLDLPDGKEIRSLTLRASIDDLRAYGDGTLSESAARARIEVKES